MDLMNDFEVAEDIFIASLTSHELQSALDTTWVGRWEGFEVRSKLCIRGCSQQVEDLVTLVASTPVLYMLKLLVVMSTAMGLHIFCFNNMTAFLHAFLNPEEPSIFVWPPEELFPRKQII